MPFIILTFLAAMLLEIIGSYVSVMGLKETFQGDTIILILAVVLDFAKIIVVSLLYTHWKQLHVILRGYLVPAALVTMLITSYGAAGYLSSSFQKASLSNQQAVITLEANEAERTKLEARLKQINDTVAGIKADSVSKRLREVKAHSAEVATLNTRVQALDAEVPTLKKQIAEMNAHLGPVAFIAKAFSIQPESAISVIIGLIIFVFDPLAVMLIIAGNSLLEIRAKSRKPEEVPEVVPPEVVPPEVVPPEVVPESPPEPIVEAVEAVQEDLPPSVAEEPETALPTLSDDFDGDVTAITFDPPPEVPVETVEAAMEFLPIDPPAPEVIDPPAVAYSEIAYSDAALAEIEHQEPEAAIAVIDEPAPVEQPVSVETQPTPSIELSSDFYHDQWESGIKPVLRSALDGVNPEQGGKMFRGSEEL